MSQHLSPEGSVRVRVQSNNSSVSSSRPPSAPLLGDGEFTCIPGVRVFNSDGSARASYRSEIGSAYIMLPDGTYQRYDEFCQKCSSPLLGDRVKVNVILDQHKGNYPLQFKNQLIYSHLQYKTCLNNQWVTVLGSTLHVSGDPQYLILNDSNYGTPYRIYEVFPVNNVSTTSYPFYYRGLYIDRERRYKIFVNNRYVVVFGSQLSPGADPNSLYLNQGPNNFVLVTEIYSYDSIPAPVAPTATQPTYSFLYRGLPIYTYGYYKIYINAQWLTVLGSQLAPTPDGSAVIYYQNPNTPIRVEQIVAVTPDQPIRPISPRTTSYNPYHKAFSPSITPSRRSPSRGGKGGGSPSPSRHPHPPGGRSSPGYYGNNTAVNYYNQQTSTSQTTYNNNTPWNTKPQQQQPQQKQPSPRQPKQTSPRQPSPRQQSPQQQEAVPSTATYPFKYYGVYIHEDRMYQVKINEKWEVVRGNQIRPIPGNDKALIVSLDKDRAGIVSEIYLYQPERYTPVNLSIRNIVIKPNLTYYVDLGPNVGCLIVKGSKIQRHPNRSSGMVWFKGTYHEIIDCRMILNGESEEMLGSQLAPTPDGSAVIYYQNPNTPIRVEQIVAVTPDQPIRPISPRTTSYNPYHKAFSPSITPSRRSPSRGGKGGGSPSPSRHPHPPGGRSSPGYYGNNTAVNYYNQQTSTSQTTYNNNTPWNTKPQQQQPQQKQPSPRQPKQTSPRQPSPRQQSPQQQEAVPSTATYPFKYYGVYIHEDRMYQVKINEKWEVVRGNQIRPIPGNDKALIVSLDKDRAGIVSEIYLYQPERYTPVNLSIRNIVIKPNLTYYVDLGPNVGCLIVKGSKIQRHPNRSSGMVWFKGTYHEIIDCRMILNGESEESAILDNGEGDDGDKCQCGAPCSILPFQCPNCPTKEQKPPSPAPIPVPPPPTQPLPPTQPISPGPHHSKSPTGILRSPSRTGTTTTTHHSERRVEKSVKILTSSPEMNTSSSSSLSSEEDRKIFKNIKIEPDALYSVLLENNTTKIVSGRLIRTKSTRKYVKVTLDNETYKSYFIRPVTPECDDEITPITSTGFYRIYINAKWRVIPANNVRPSKQRPGRFVVVYNSSKYYVKAVNVVPVILPEGSKYPTAPAGGDHPTCSSPVHPHPISPEQHMRQQSASPDTNTLPHTLGELSVSSSQGSDEGSKMVPLSALYDQWGRLKPEFAGLLGSREPSVILPDRPGESPFVVLPNGGYKQPDRMPSPPKLWEKPPTPPLREPSPPPQPSTAIPVAINGTLVHTERQYTLTVNSETVTVYGRHFKARKQHPGQYTVKVGDCRYLVPIGTTILPVQQPTKTVTFGPDATLGEGDSDSDIGEGEQGYLVLIQGSWVRTGPKAVRPSKTQAGYAVVKHRDSVHLVLETDIRPLGKNEEVVNLECTLANGRRLIRTWFVEKLPRNCLDSIKTLARNSGEEPVFIIRNSSTRNINDVDIRKFTSCIRVHFEHSQIIFEDDYLQLAETGFGAACPIWVIIRKNRSPKYYKMISDLTGGVGPHMDVSVSDNSYRDYTSQPGPSTGGFSSQPGPSSASSGFNSAAAATRINTTATRTTAATTSRSTASRSATGFSSPRVGGFSSPRPTGSPRARANTTGPFHPPPSTSAFTAASSGGFGAGFRSSSSAGRTSRTTVKSSSNNSTVKKSSLFNRLERSGIASTASSGGFGAGFRSSSSAGRTSRTTVKSSSNNSTVKKSSLFNRLERSGIASMLAALSILDGGDCKLTTVPLKLTAAAASQ
eukprot:sb/3460687/